MQLVTLVKKRRQILPIFRGLRAGLSRLPQASANAPEAFSIEELARVQPPKARCGRFLLGLVRTAGRSKWATRKEKRTSATRRFLLRSSA